METVKNLRQDSKFPGQDLNCVPQMTHVSWVCSTLYNFIFNAVQEVTKNIDM